MDVREMNVLSCEKAREEEKAGYCHDFQSLESNSAALLGDRPTRRTAHRGKLCNAIVALQFLEYLHGRLIVEIC